MPPLGFPVEIAETPVRRPDGQVARQHPVVDDES